MRLLLVALVMTLGQFIPITADAKTIRLKNGKALEGEVESMTEQEITVAITGVGSLTLSRAEVVGIDDAPPATDSSEHQGQVFINSEWMSVEAAQTVSASVTKANQSQQPSDYKPGRFTYYGSSEEDVAQAQRDLERAIRQKAPKEDIERLKQVIRLNKQRLAAREAEQKREEARLEAKRQQAKAKPDDTDGFAEQSRKEWRKATGNESGSVRVGHTEAVRDPMTGETLGYTTY